MTAPSNNNEFYAHVQGTIPYATFKDFGGLTTADLSNNLLTGSIPESIRWVSVPWMPDGSCGMGP